MKPGLGHFSSPKTANTVVVLLLMVTCIFLSVLIPPMQSPDEHDHIERAYLLRKGVFVLSHPDAMPSGGLIDLGLLKYQKTYELVKTRLTADVTDAASHLKWTGDTMYNPSPGTGYYFPVIYAPQALGLAMGEALGLTIDHSYRLARAFATFAAGVLVLLAFRIYPVNALVLGLLAIPMTLFQFSSAGLDGISTALAMLSIASFMRIASDGAAATRLNFYVLAIAVTVLLTSRAHLLPFMAFLLAAYFYCRRDENFFLFLLSTSLILVWTAIAIKTTLGVVAAGSESTASIVWFYLKQPGVFLEVLWKTVSDKSTTDFYHMSFLGILGWLDAQFAAPTYTGLTIGLAAMALAAVIAAVMSPAVGTSLFGRFKKDWSQRLLLVVVALSSVLLIFFALLVTWTPHPASLILGVQGRYFLVPLMVLAYSVAGSHNMYAGRAGVASVSLCLCFFIFSAASTFDLLLSRYYTAPYQFKVEQLPYAFGGVGAQGKKMVANGQLGERDPIRLKLTPADHSASGQLARVGVMMATHSRQNVGLAELVLTAATGAVYRQEFALAELADNQYKYFNVPVATYISGEIRSLSGGGISVWESHAANGEALTCINYLYANNKLVVIAGCP